MKRQIIFLPLILLFLGCSHLPKCGNPDGAKVVLVGKDSCQVRIRQVSIGDELKIPQGVKATAISEFSLSWKDAELREGQIELGHYILLPVDQKKEGP